MVAGVTASSGGMQTASFVYSIEKKSLASTLQMLLPEDGFGTHIMKQGSTNELSSPIDTEAYPPYSAPLETDVDIATDGKIMSLTIPKAVEMLCPATVAPPSKMFFTVRGEIC